MAERKGWAALDAIGEAARTAREYVSPWKLISATDVASFAPGGGIAQAATENFPRGWQALKQGNYGEAASNYLGGTLGVGGDLMWAAGPVIGATAGSAMKAAGKSVSKGGLAELGKTVWSDLSKTKHPIPVEDMRAIREPTGDLLPRRTTTPAELQGSILMPAVGDRTAAGARLLQVNDTPLSFPVSLEGGGDFMRSAAHQADGSLWASDKGVITRLAKHTANLGNSGKDVNLVYSAMGARSGDYSHMMSDALLAQLEGSKITNKAARAFDESMKAQGVDWPGLRSPNLREALLSSGPMRKAMVEEMALGTHQAAGFPEIGSTRFAITEPALIGQPTGASGYAIGRLDPSGKVISSPTVPHTTYNTQLGGEAYLGGFDRQVPRELMFPDFFKTRREAGLPKLADDRAFSMSNVSQDANQQWLDNIMRYIEDRP